MQALLRQEAELSFQPANGQRIVNPTAAFLQWTHRKTATSYYPWIGSYPGGNDIYNVGEVTTTSATVGNLAPKATLLDSYVGQPLRGVVLYRLQFTTGVMRGLSPTRQTEQPELIRAPSPSPGPADSTAIAYYPTWAPHRAPMMYSILVAASD